MLARPVGAHTSGSCLTYIREISSSWRETLAYVSDIGVVRDFAVDNFRRAGWDNLGLKKLLVAQRMVGALGARRAYRGGLLSGFEHAILDDEVFGCGGYAVDLAGDRHQLFFFLGKGRFRRRNPAETCDNLWLIDHILFACELICRTCFFHAWRLSSFSASSCRCVMMVVVNGVLLLASRTDWISRLFALIYGQTWHVLLALGWLLTASLLASILVCHLDSFCDFCGARIRSVPAASITLLTMLLSLRLFRSFLWFVLREGHLLRLGLAQGSQNLPFLLFKTLELLTLRKKRPCLYYLP